MPLFRAAHKLIYYAHVPKAAGTTVEDYMAARFGAPALLDDTFAGLPEAEKWSDTSPQHMPEDVRLRLLPDAFIDASFATVRHPATRLRSVFLFQREIEGRIPKKTKFATWLDILPQILADDPNAFDGHIRPMCATVPAAAKVFAIEQGLAPLVTWLDAVTDSQDDTVPLEPRNVLSTRLIFEKRALVYIALEVETLEKIAALYAGDYARFGYDLMPPEQEPFE